MAERDPVVPEDLAAALEAGGDAGQQIAAHDWASTPLGPMQDWPPRLRVLVATMLRSSFAMLISWGPELIQLYNDRYREILGSTKHPAFGESTRDTFAEAWEEHIAPRFLRPLEQGASFYTTDFPLPLDRHGWLEECHFAGAYDPIDGGDGSIAGVLTTCIETTERVVNERRLERLSVLGASADAMTDLDGLTAILVRTLAASPDTPAAMLLRPAIDHCTVVASAGFAEAPGRIHLGADAIHLLVDRTDRGMVPLGALGLDAELHPDWPEPARHGWVADLGDHLLVLALHPGLWFDDDFRRFVELVADRVTTAIDQQRRRTETEAHLEALRELDRMKDALLSDVSHELRTPLTLVAGAIDELRDREELSAEDRRSLWATAERSVERLRRQVDSLLTFGRISGGHVEATKVWTDVGARTREVCETFEAEIRRGGLDFDVDLPGTPVHAAIDPAMWETVLFNLLSNAFRFTFGGSITVHLAVEAAEVVLEVADTGVGIPADEIPRVFERFQRVRGGLARTEEGAGIGLALVGDIVRLHGGTIDVDSDVGRGTRLRVRVPVGDPDETPPAVTVAQTVGNEGAPPGPDPGRTVLVVEDHDELRVLMARALERHWPTVTAADGRAALDLLGAQSFDVVVTDFMMPVVDGPALIRALRDDARTRDVPVLLLTGAGVPEQAGGADQVLRKPFRLDELVRAVGVLLAAR
jgi:signal transduction histidine kinase